MKQVQLLDRQRQVVGSVTWAPPGDIQVDIADAQLAASVRALVAEARKSGLPLRCGGAIEHDGKQVFVERTETVTPDDERFLSAFAEKLSRIDFSGHRLFGVTGNTE